MSFWQKKGVAVAAVAVLSTGVVGGSGISTTFVKNAPAAESLLDATGKARNEEYRERAAECQEIANHWSDLIKQQYEELARQWLMLS